MSCDEFVRANAGQLPWMKLISVIRPDGVVICSSRARNVGVDVSRLSHFRRAIEDGQFALGDYFYVPQLGPAIFAAHAHRDASGKIDAVVSANLDVDWFARLTAAVGEQHNSVVMLFDSAGTMSDAAQGKLKEIGAVLATAPDVNVQITGYGESEEAGMNQANSVKNSLTKTGVSTERISTRGEVGTGAPSLKLNRP